METPSFLRKSSKKTRAYSSSKSFAVAEEQNVDGFTQHKFVFKANQAFSGFRQVYENSVQHNIHFIDLFNSVITALHTNTHMMK